MFASRNSTIRSVDLWNRVKSDFLLQYSPSQSTLSELQYKWFSVAVFAQPVHTVRVTIQVIFCCSIRPASPHCPSYNTSDFLLQYSQPVHTVRVTIQVIFCCSIRPASPHCRTMMICHLCPRPGFQPPHKRYRIEPPAYFPSCVYLTVKCIICHFLLADRPTS